jgi:ABC-2 type transport system permease protein
LLYVYLARTGYLRNLAYRWSHMVNNLASALFGFIYIFLWQAVAPPAGSGALYNQRSMTHMLVLAQVFAWISAFLPAGLDIQTSVRTGSIALEMARPVPYFAAVMAREAGNLVYQGLYRSVPLALLFALTVGFPAPGSLMHLLLTVPSLVLAAYIALLMFYTVGLSSLWTTEIRWAHYTYHSLLILLSGGWVPADTLPGVLGQVAPYLPFAAQMFYPVRIYLGFSGMEGLLIQLCWAVALTLWCLHMTACALRRVVIQGG